MMPCANGAYDKAELGQIGVPKSRFQKGASKNAHPKTQTRTAHGADSHWGPQPALDPPRKATCGCGDV